jgi:GNAT superfamily N-acetyltransferase
MTDHKERERSNQERLNREQAVRERGVAIFRSASVYTEAERVNPGLNIVPYASKWADEVAAMWNDSRESWGASDSVRTGEQVQREETTDDFLSLELAVLDDHVIGYCKLEKDQSDPNALYVSLLNVRNGHHGKKIGKALLIRALARTIELGYPRLDLHTWAGNTEAVPLYKKCGFFWEERDDTVHLMNFLPGLLQTELIQHHLEGVDWYKDNVRHIAIEPDGTKENDFHYYTYEWVTPSETLQVQMEREGKGVRSVTTDDFSLTMAVPVTKPVAGKQYAAQFDIVNKSGEPLEVNINGQNDKNIRFQTKETFVLAAGESRRWCPQFAVESFDEDHGWRVPRRRTPDLRRADPRGGETAQRSARTRRDDGTGGRGGRAGVPRACGLRRRADDEAGRRRAWGRGALGARCNRQADQARVRWREARPARILQGRSPRVADPRDG